MGDGSKSRIRDLSGWFKLKIANSMATASSRGRTRRMSITPPPTRPSLDLADSPFSVASTPGQGYGAGPTWRRFSDKENLPQQLKRSLELPMHSPHASGPQQIQRSWLLQAEATSPSSEERRSATTTAREAPRTHTAPHTKKLAQCLWPHLPARQWVPASAPPTPTGLRAVG
jgi:hypothetical protein